MDELNSRLNKITKDESNRRKRKIIILLSFFAGLFIVGIFLLKDNSTKEAAIIKTNSVPKKNIEVITDSTGIPVTQQNTIGPAEKNNNQSKIFSQEIKQNKKSTNDIQEIHEEKKILAKPVEKEIMEIPPMLSEEDNTLSATIQGSENCETVTFPTPLSETDNPVDRLPVAVPNGDFENWNSMLLPDSWTTNSCPVCVSPFMTDIVRRDSDACGGFTAAKFLYNNVNAAWAENRFAVHSHPLNLTACVKCNLTGTDTVLIKVNLLNNSNVVDSGLWLNTNAINNYTQIMIPITQNSLPVDSIVIFIRGGQGSRFPSNNTEFWVDKIKLN
jgi:hypothetical protein